MLGLLLDYCTSFHAPPPSNDWDHSILGPSLSVHKYVYKLAFNSYLLKPEHESININF